MGLMDKKDNTKNAEHVNTVYYLNKQLCLIHVVIHIGLCCEVIQGPYMLCSFDVTCTSLLVYMYIYIIIHIHIHTHTHIYICNIVCMYIIYIKILYSI